ncbi:electron transfer flavoprotein subunit alpha/FixB family protein, partial [Flavobacteriaceae bacterium]|nr:electron transfer flavoprotein subunit alpha/FixB family protein [Flavobacteriaceae bacterium]
LTINTDDVNELSNYGITKIIKVNNESLNKFNASTFADVISKACNHSNSNHIVLSSSLDSKYLAPLLAANINATYGYTWLHWANTNKVFQSLKKLNHYIKTTK